jgi:hypothetical protein
MDHPRPVMRRGLTGLGFGLIFASLLVTRAGAAPQDKITICHRTSSVQNPYVQQTVNENSIVMSNGSPTGHGLHTGPVFPQPNWGDVIPPFTYANDRGGTSVYGGMNWSTDGQAIWNGGCEVDLTEPPEETTTTTTTTTLPLPTTTSAPTTTTRPGSTTTRPGSTTTHPGSTTTEPGSTTTHPGSTTTQPVGGTTTTEPSPGTTPTTAPSTELPHPITDPGIGVEIMPPVEAVVVDSGNRTVDLGPLSTSQRMTLEAVVDSLAGTGQNEMVTTLGAVLLILLGSFLLVGSRRIGRGDTGHRSGSRAARTAHDFGPHGG